MLPARSLIYIPGEEAAPVVQPIPLREDTQDALFLYRQTFPCPESGALSTRTGVMGRIGDRANIHPHEEVDPAGVEACRSELRRNGACISSLFLYTHAPLDSLLGGGGEPWAHYKDRSGCVHQFWRVTDAAWIASLQHALGDGPLFLADGHHRFAAGWQLATIQMRTSALQTFAAHRLVQEKRDLQLPPTHAVAGLNEYRAGTPIGRARFGVLLPELRGFEIACEPGIPPITALHRQVLRGARVRPVRGLEAAAKAVRAAEAEMAILVEAPSLDVLEAGARKGILLPPKSTDFFPKLAAGLVMCRH